MAAKRHAGLHGRPFRLGRSGFLVLTISCVLSIVLLACPQSENISIAHKAAADKA